MFRPAVHRHFVSSLRLGITLGLALFAMALAQAAEANQPPVIESFAVSQQPADCVEFYGYVSDPNNSTQGYVVYFGGLVDGLGLSATVGADGTFDEVFYLPDLQSGIITADTTDPQEAEAETAEYWYWPWR